MNEIRYNIAIVFSDGSHTSLEYITEQQFNELECQINDQGQWILIPNSGLNTEYINKRHIRSFAFRKLDEREMQRYKADGWQ